MQSDDATSGPPAEGERPEARGGDTAVWYFVAATFLFGWSSGLFGDGDRSWSHALFAALAVLLLIGGLVALRRETRRPR